MKRDENGLYSYWYCIETKELPSVVLESKTSAISLDSTNLRVNAFNGSAGEPCSFCLTLDQLNSDNQFFTCSSFNSTTCELTIPNGDYSLKAYSIGFTDFRADSIRFNSGEMVELSIGLGVAGAFNTIDISSKKRLMKWQLRSKAKKWRREYYSRQEASTSQSVK
jgi:hypothetical protein